MAVDEAAVVDGGGARRPARDGLGGARGREQHERGAVARLRPDLLARVGGLYREQMFGRIERERRRWYVAFSGGSLSDVLVAVEAGVGVTLLPGSAPAISTG